jgi:hypothetical protein
MLKQLKRDMKRFNTLRRNAMTGKFPFVIFVCALFVTAFPFPATAEIEDSTTLSFTASSLPEAQLALTQAWTFPMLQGDNFLTAGNNLKTALFYNISPVSTHAGLDLTLTPIAFAQIKTGGSIGSGWNFPVLDIAPHAWGLNKPQKDGSGLIEGEPLEAAIWKVYGGVVLQFDVGALIPGDWTHVLVQINQQINYRANTLAGPTDSWSHENDGGENRNAPYYYANYVLGYQLPGVPVFDMAAIMAEMELYFYDTPNRHFFGDDLPKWTFSALANLVFTRWFSAALIAQFRLDRNFINGTEENFYQLRELDQHKPFSFNFYRVAAILSFALR